MIWVQILWGRIPPDWQRPLVSPVASVSEGQGRRYAAGRSRFWGRSDADGQGVTRPQRCAKSLKKMRTCAMGLARTSSLFM